MCGLYFYPSDLQINDDHFKKLLIHRGPDYQNSLQKKKFIIGHNLLSIRGELKQSIQPLNINNKYIISFNGEIYNTEDIINKFNLDKSPNDTNVIQQLVKKIGKNFIDHIEGMYAIILFDIDNDEVSIFRDHSGQKNIYYYKSNFGIVLSSELLPISKIESFKSEVDYDHIHQSLSIGHSCSERTIFKKIKKLKPGQMITFDSKGTIILNKISKKKNDEKFKNCNIFESIDETIKTHTFSKDKIGINLSSGLDSNIVLYHAIKHKSNIEAFSTYFEDVEDNYNLDYFGAKKISNHYGIKFNQTSITKKNYEDMFSKSFTNIEEINRNLGNPSYLLNYINQKKNDFRVVLSGDGGDEIFVGYNWYFKGRFRENFLKRLGFFGKNMKLFTSLFNYLSQFNRYNSFTNKKFLNYKFDNKFNYNEISRDINEFIKNNFSNKIYEFNNLKLFLDQYLWLPNEILLRADKLGMMNSLEVRNPFCDQNLRKKLMNDLQKNDFFTPENKYKIREIYKTKLPKEALKNTKYGWTSPKEWIKSSNIKTEILDNIPNIKSDYFNWSNIKDEIISDENIMSKRSIYPLISLIFIIKKFNLDI